MKSKIPKTLINNITTNIRYHKFAFPRIKPGALRCRNNFINNTRRLEFIRKFSDNSSSNNDDTLLKETSELIELCNLESKNGTLIQRTTFDNLMSQWTKRVEKDGMKAVKKVLELLKVLESNLEKDFSGEEEDSSNQLIPDAASYNFLLHAYATCNGGVEAAEAASEELEKMLERCREYHNNTELNRIINVQSLAPTTRTFNIVLNAWSKTKDERAGEMAESIYNLMEDWMLECRGMSIEGAIPNSRTLSAVMDAWAQSRALDATERVMAILEVAIERRKKFLKKKDISIFLNEGGVSNNVVVKPDVHMFNIAIHSWAISGKGKYGAQKAENLLNRMMILDESNKLGPRNENDEDDGGLTPTMRSYSSVINAWAESSKKDKTGQSATQAQKILENMIERYHTGEDTKPNTIVFSNCMKAWAGSLDHENYAINTQAIFDRMASLYRETNDESVKPSTVSANILLSAWAGSKSEDSMERAEETLRSMQEFCSPDLYSFNTIMNAYIQKDNYNRAYSIFQELQKNDSITPDIVSYNTALNALAKMRGGQEALELLDKMCENPNVKPNTLSYTCTINALARNYHDKNSFYQITKLLNTMLQEYRNGNKHLKPDNFTYSIVIGASIFADTRKKKREALKFSITALEEMKRSKDLDNPNHVTYASLLRACSKLSSRAKERIRLMCGVFEQCCEDGMVGKITIEAFQRGVPQNVQKKYSIQYGKSVRVPKAWCDNVTKKKDKPEVLD